MSSILLSELDKAFFLQNVHSKHSSMARAWPKLKAMELEDIVLAYSPRAAAKYGKLKQFILICVLFTAKAKWDAPAQANKPKTIAEILRGLDVVREFDANGSLFGEEDYDRDEGFSGDYARSEVYRELTRRAA